MNWRDKLGPLYPFAVALQFFTRLPMPRDLNPERSDLNRSAVFLPLVGAVVGGLLAVSVWVTAAAGLAPALQAFLVLVLGALLTGVFHEDGLADTADGLGGGHSVAKKLEIMRDSRIGSYGTVALILLYAGRMAALLSISGPRWPAALLVAAVVGRGAVLPLIAWLPYARDEGKAKPVVESQSHIELWVSAGLSLLFGFLIAPDVIVLIGLVLVAWVSGAGRLFQSQLGGITGDGLGAVNVTAELWVLIGFSLL